MPDDRLLRLEHRVSELETRGAVDEVHRANVESRLSAIEEALKWLVRLIIGTLATTALAYALQGSLAF